MMALSPYGARFTRLILKERQLALILRSTSKGVEGHLRDGREPDEEVKDSK